MDGYSSLKNSDIRGLSRLEINGNEAVNEATIISEVKNGSTFIAMIDGMC